LIIDLDNLWPSAREEALFYQGYGATEIDPMALAYYRFDNSKVEDYVVALKQTAQYDSTEIDAYPKAGMTSPVADLYIYDLDSKQSVQVDVRDGKPFEDKTLGYYVYRIAWAHDG